MSEINKNILFRPIRIYETCTVVPNAKYKLDRIESASILYWHRKQQQWYYRNANFAEVERNTQMGEFWFFFYNYSAFDWIWLRYVSITHVHTVQCFCKGHKMWSMDFFFFQNHARIITWTAVSETTFYKIAKRLSGITMNFYWRRLQLYDGKLCMKIIYKECFPLIYLHNLFLFILCGLKEILYSVDFNVI